MNQILVTKRLYITPELKRKKKLYKISLFLSVFLLCILCSVYIYAEYDRNKEEEISHELLSNMYVSQNNNNEVTKEKDNTTISSEENDVLVIVIGNNKENSETSNTETTNEENSTAQTTTEQTTTAQASTTQVTTTTRSKYNETANVYSSKSKTEEMILSGVCTAANGETFSICGIISIPKINITYPIISETNDTLLRVSTCKFWGADPNKVGNCCIVGHNYRDSRFFGRVPTLVCGDIVEITDLSNNTLNYEVYDIYTVTPDDRSCTSQLTNGRKEITLITCTNDSKGRIVVKARQVG